MDWVRDGLLTNFFLAGWFVGGVAGALGQGEPARELNTVPVQGIKAMKVIKGGAVKIVLTGDSTVATEGGWGPGFCAVMTRNVTCIDDALNGRSSKSFRDEGAWDKALAEKGDYYFIQWGHNDQKKEDPKRYTDPETDYQANLKRYIADVRPIGAVPVLVTSLSRRTFRDGELVEDLKPYVAATKKVGAEESVTVVDLNAISVAMLKKMTQEEADTFDAELHSDAKAENAKPGLDRTHLNPYGQKVFGRLVADQVVRTLVELGPDVVGEPVSGAGK
jgi:lysophospholipase L1-like esterase